MKRFFFLSFFLLFFSLPFMGQELSYLLHTDKKTFSFGQSSFLDPYLSQLPYDGFSVAFLKEGSRLLSENRMNYSKRSRFFFKAGSAYSPTKTSSILFSKFRYDWGMYRHFSPYENLLLLVGGYADLDLGVKYYARNSNNPVSFDVATNINFSVRCLYDFQLFKLRNKLRAEVLFELPLVGLMFVPPLGLSYYEMSLSNSFLKQMHFSSLHNKQGSRMAIRLELPLGSAVYSLGISREKWRYGVNEIVLRESDLFFSLGYVQKFSLFNAKRPAPLNFLTY